MAAPDLYPTFSDRELGGRLEAVRAKMELHDFTALIVYGAGRSADVQYLTNWPGTRESFVIVTAREDPVLLVQLFNHVPTARRVAATSDVRWAGPGSSEAVLSTLVELRLPEQGRVGLVGPWRWQDVGRLAARFRDVAFSDDGGIFAELRAIKSAEELERLRIAARLTDRAMTALERGVRPGMREYELAAIVEGAYLPDGGVNSIHFMAATPMRAPEIGVPSQIASSRAMARGDVLITEIGAEWWGYAGQIHRAYAIGAEPTDDYRRLHDVAVEAYERIVDVLHDGATVADVLNAAEVIHQRGFTVYDDLLHGTSQLPPIIQTRGTKRGNWQEDFVFREDMVVVVQPNVTSDETGRMGVQVGETVRITKTGVERLHEYPLRFVVCAR